MFGAPVGDRSANFFTTTCFLLPIFSSTSGAAVLSSFNKTVPQYTLCKLNPLEVTNRTSKEKKKKKKKKKNTHRIKSELF